MPKFATPFNRKKEVPQIFSKHRALMEVVKDPDTNAVSLDYVKNIDDDGNITDEIITHDVYEDIQNEMEGVLLIKDMITFDKKTKEFKDVNGKVLDRNTLPENLKCQDLRDVPKTSEEYIKVVKDAREIMASGFIMPDGSVNPKFIASPLPVIDDKNDKNDKDDKEVKEVK